MDDWQRAIRFIRAIDEGAAEEIVPFSWGRALINRRFDLVHDANYLLADRLDGATAAELIAAAERIQGPLGLAHRRVNVDDQSAASALTHDFEAGGYLAERFTVMVLKSSSHRPPDDRPVRELSWHQVRPARQEERLDQDWAYPALVDQILARQELTATLIGTRYFGAVIDGEVVSSCELRTAGSCAQIETVETLERFRNRGLASAVVDAAIHAARQQDFVFLVADHDDWPQHWYRRLGFDPVGIESRFLRLVYA